MPKKFYILFVCFLFTEMYGNAQFPNENLKLPAVDSIPKKVLQSAKSDATSSFQQLKKNITDSLLPFNSLLKEINSGIKSPIKLNRANIFYSGMFDSSYLLYNASSYIGNLTASSEWSVAGIPASVNLINQSWSDISQNKNWVSVKFDKDNYLESLQKRLSKKIDPSQYLKLTEDAAKNMIDNAKQELLSDLKGINDSYKNVLSDELSFIGQIKDVSAIDVKSLRNKFLNKEFLQEVAQKEKLLTSLQQKINNGEKINEQQLVSLQQQVSKLKGVQDLIKKVEDHSSKWSSSGLLKKIKETQLLSKSTLNQLMHDPVSIRKMAKQYLSLKGLQRFFLSMNRFDIGQNALSLSPMSFQHFLSNGGVADFLSSKGKSFLIMAGKQKDFNSIVDYNFSSALVSSNGTAKAARIEIGKSKVSTTHIALSSFNQSLINSFAPSISADYRKTLVTTFSNEFIIGQKGQVGIDISRSATQYAQTAPVTDSTLGIKGPLKEILSGNNLFDNSSVAVSYSDEFPLNGLSYQIHFNKVSNGYSNPGSVFLSNGSTESGFAVRKTFLENKFQFSLRGNNREYKFDPTENRKWRSIYVTVDGRWKLKKGQYVAIRYQPASMTRIEPGKKFNVSSISRISADASLYKRFHKTTYRNLITLSYQQSSYSFVQTISRTSSVLVNSFQNISLGKNLLFINSSYNKANNESGYLSMNSSFMTEAGYTFQLFGKLSASSGITYSSVEGWYRQVGIRQSLNGQLGEKFNVSLYVDARKNLSVIQPLWNQPIRADIAIHYFLGHNE